MYTIITFVPAIYWINDQILNNIIYEIIEDVRVKIIIDNSVNEIIIN